MILYFQPATLLKMRFQHKCFLRILQIFLVCNFIKNKTPTQMFSCGFCEIFKNIYFENICKSLLLMIYSLLDSFVKFVVHLNEKQKDIKDSCSEKCLCIFLILLVSGKTSLIACLGSNSCFFLKNIDLSKYWKPRTYPYTLSYIFGNIL